MLDLTEKQKENEQWYKEHLDSFLKDQKLKGKYLVIHDKKVKKAFEHEHNAIEFVFKEYKNFDECIIREAIDEKEVINFVNVKFRPIRQ